MEAAACATGMRQAFLAFDLIAALANVQLELANMFKNGDLQSMWEVARQTDLTFNMVGGHAGFDGW